MIEAAGHLLLASCAIPAALQALLARRSTVPWSLLVPRGLGEIGAAWGAWDREMWVALINYLTNIIAIGIMIRCRIIYDRWIKLAKENR